MAEKSVFDQWVDATAEHLKKNCQNANIVIIAHVSPGVLEAIYSNQDPVIAQGMLRNANLALDEQIKSVTFTGIRKADNNDVAGLYNDAVDKKKVN